MLHIRALEKTYPARGGAPPARALGGVDLSVAKGAFFALLGPSGCGKTTLLQCLAGLETPDRGSIVIGDVTAFDSDKAIATPANRRGLGMVFQSYAIWPHMTVAENVAFPLQHGSVTMSRDKVGRLVAAALERVKLSGYADRLAPHLSGGQQQRVALARAIVHEPQLLLLDEPLSNLDARLRDEMRVELRQLVKSLGITTIFVTHDQGEAMSMADEIALLQNGRIVQRGAPEDFYFRPSTAFAANFVGQCNILPAQVIEARVDGAAVIRTPAGLLVSKNPFSLKPGDKGQCVIRPNAFLSAQSHDATDNVLQGRVLRRAFLGDTVDVVAQCGDASLHVALNAYEASRLGETVALHVPWTRCILVARDEGP